MSILDIDNNIAQISVRAQFYNDRNEKIVTFMNHIWDTIQPRIIQCQNAKIYDPIATKYSWRGMFKISYLYAVYKFIDGKYRADNSGYTSHYFTFAPDDNINDLKIKFMNKMTSPVFDADELGVYKIPVQISDINFIGQH